VIPEVAAEDQEDMKEVPREDSWVEGLQIEDLATSIPEGRHCRQNHSDWSSVDVIGHLCSPGCMEPWLIIVMTFPL
jgi:hypothetical protein